MRDRFPIFPVLIGLAGVIAVILLMVMADGPSDGGARKVQNSAIGTRILGPWLRAGGVPVEESNPRVAQRLDAMGLRILPLYDMNLIRDAEEPQTAKAAFEATSLVDLASWVYVRKVTELPTLVILPKWRRGIQAVEVAHASLLIPEAEYPTLLDQIALDGIRLTRDGARMMTASLPDGGNIALFHAQLFDPASLPGHCRPKISVPAGVLLVYCRHDTKAVSGDLAELPQDGSYILSDPDLMNNHGLRLAGNAAAARELVASLISAPEKSVYLDLSTELLLTEAAADPGSYYQRELGDFGKFFSAPFTVLWSVLLITMAVLIWRGSVTLIPRRAQVLHEEARAGQSHPGLASATAKARLLRIGGHDGRMVAAFVQSEILRVHQQILGRHPGPEVEAKNSMLMRLHAIWTRRDRARADRLLLDAQALTNQTDAMTPAERARILNNFRENLEILTDENPDPGRISGSRRRSAP